MNDFLSTLIAMFTTQLNDTLAAIGKALMALFVTLGLVAGCTITGRNAGTAWFEIGTRFEFGHTNSKTSDEPSTVGVDGKALVNHVIDLREDKDEGAPK